MKYDKIQNRSQKNSHSCVPLNNVPDPYHWIPDPDIFFSSFEDATKTVFFLSFFSLNTYPQYIYIIN